MAWTKARFGNELRSNFMICFMSQTNYIRKRPTVQRHLCQQRAPINLIKCSMVELQPYDAHLFMIPRPQMAHSFA